MKKPTLRATALALLVLAATAAAAGAPHIVERHALGGTGQWDLLTLDASARRLYVTREDHVMVVDVDSGKLLGDVPGAKHAHGVAIVPALHRGYVSNGHADSLTVFDTGSFKVLGEIAVTGKSPDALVFEPASGHLFAFNGHSSNATVIDPATGKVIATLALPGRPEFALADGKGRIYLNLEDKNQVAVVDAKSGKVTATWSLGTCDGPTGLALDGVHQRLFSVCANKQMAVIAADDGHHVATLPIGDGPDSAAFDAATGDAYSANADGTLTVIHQDDADHYRVVANIATPIRSRAVALDATTHRAFLAAAKFGTPPAPTVAEPKPKGPMKPGSFELLVIAAN